LIIRIGPDKYFKCLKCDHFHPDGGKKFASKFGFILSAILTLSVSLQLEVVVMVLGGVLVLFAILESALAN
jgi:hypothetical protein